MGERLGSILAFSVIALVVIHPGRIEGRPLPQNQSPSIGTDACPGAPNVSPPALPCTVRDMALPDKPEPNFAEESSRLAALPAKPEPKPKPGSKPELEPKGNKRAWLLLALAQHSAAGLDAYTTRVAIGVGQRELDPLMRPFAHSPAIYPATQVGPALVDLLGYRMMKSRKRWARRIWWVPQTVATAGFIWAGERNLDLLFHLSHHVPPGDSPAFGAGAKIRAHR